jgi:hypothetical protein
MDVIVGSPIEIKWNAALKHMQSALDMLDDSGAPGDIGSHLDLAICRLEDALGCDPADNTIQQLQAEIENALTTPTTEESRSDALLWPSHHETTQVDQSDRAALIS